MVPAGTAGGTGGVPSVRARTGSVPRRHRARSRRHRPRRSRARRRRVRPGGAGRPTTMCRPCRARPRPGTRAAAAPGGRPAARPARAAHARPAHLGHRSLQLPLHLLHAGARSSGATTPSCRASQILTFEEIARLARLFVGLGVEKLRITGGEPTVRRDLPDLVADAGRDRRRARPHADHERLGAPATRRAARGRRACAGSRSASIRSTTRSSGG